MIEAIRHSSRARWRRSEAGSGGRTRELPGSHSKAFDSVLGPLTLERAYVTPGVKDGEATTSSMKTIRLPLWYLAATIARRSGP